MSRLEQELALGRVFSRCRCRSFARNILVAAVTFGLMMALSAVLISAYAGNYDTDAWGGKFRYGAYSTLISSHVLGIKYHDLVILLSEPLRGDADQQINKMGKRLAAFREDYNSLDDDRITEIITAAARDETPSIYEEERSIVSNIEQNNVFIKGMTEHPELAPVDRLIENDKFRIDNFQFNAHRALYNNAYRIPQNSLAAIVNAYVAGIRSVEFDVLETSDHVNIVIHDLVTNRLDGSVNEPPKYVEQLSFDQVKDTHIDVLNPLGADRAVESTGVRHIMPTAQVLAVVHKLMPEMTLYADARNDAPVSLIRLLHQHPEYRDNVVIKIYPFTLSGGLTDLVAKYAARYTQGKEDEAYAQISNANPHVLLALGNAETESSQDVLVSGISAFTWGEFQKEAAGLPFSRSSAFSKNQFQGQPIFTKDELLDIEMQTYKLFRWSMGFAGSTNILVFQMSAVPSLLGIIQRDDVSEYKAMADHKMKAAVYDNFMQLYKRVMAGELILEVPGHAVSKPIGYSLKDRIRNAGFGLSDRYQDFTLAGRNDNGSVQQDGLRSFVYSMPGGASESDLYAARKMRSTTALVDRLHELAHDSGAKALYATTDLPTDLRMAFMGILGTHGLPADLLYRRGSLIKGSLMKKLFQNDPATFKLPDWTTRNYGDAYARNPQDFDADYKKVGDNIKVMKEKARILHDLKQTMTLGVLLLNKDALTALGLPEPATKDQIEQLKCDGLEAQLKQDIQTLIMTDMTNRSSFVQKYGAPYLPN